MREGKERCAQKAFEQNSMLIEQTANYAVAFKPNIAFYEALGEPGLTLLKATLAAIPHDIPCILDAKRGDIANTAEAYAHAMFGEFAADAVTVNPYMGLDTLEPFLAWQERVFSCFVEQVIQAQSLSKIYPKMEFLSLLKLQESALQCHHELG